MSRIHPSESNCNNLLRNEKASPCALTVLKRSSMSFHGTDGFTVFDENGGLAFRVDNYSRKNHGLVLMDGPGTPLLTLKPQTMTMRYQWNVYRRDGFGRSTKSKVFSMRRPLPSIRRSNKSEAEVFMGGSREHDGMPDFKIEGSFRRRNCKIRTHAGATVAKIARKKVNPTVLLSDDVFSLIIEPGIATELIMAFVIILDRICFKPFTPILCSH